MSSKVKAFNRNIQLLKHSDIPSLHKLHAVLLLIQAKKIYLEVRSPDEFWNEHLYEILSDITNLCGQEYEVEAMSDIMDNLSRIIDKLSAFEPLGSSQCQR